MKLKHFGLLAMLGILSWSCADDKGQFAGKDGMGEIKASFKADYSVTSSRSAGETASTEIEAISPEIQNFMVHLKKSDGSYNKTWSSIAEFPVDSKFTTGAYEMEIYYGDINEEGFEKPYYYGSGKFSVEDSETASPEIEATLGNAMVSLAYTDAFKQYFTDYSAKIHSAGGAYIDFAKDEARAAYVKPGKVTFQLSLVKSNGTELSLEPAAIDNAEARTHYRVTFDVNGGEVGDAKLSVSFDDATTAQPIEVMISEDISVAPAPVITAKGFDNATAINIIEGDEVPASVVLVAESGLGGVVLTTTSEYLISKGWPAELDLMTATAEQQALLKQYGLEVSGLWNSADKIAVVDFAGLIPNLKPLNGNSTHSFTLQVKDIYGRTAETPATLTVNAPAVVLALSNPIKSEAGSCQAAFTMTYNAKKEKLSFKAMNDYGDFVDAPIKSMTDNGDGTYAVVVTIPDNASATTVKAYYRGEEKSSINVKIGKIFTLSYEDYDIWATKATVKVNARVADFRNVVMSNVKAVYVNGTATTNYSADAANYTFTVKGLTAGAQSTIKVEITDEDGDLVFAETSFTTETAAQVANAGFEDWETKSWDFNHNGSLGGQSSPMTYYKPWAAGTGDAWWDSNVTQSLRGSLTIGYTYFKCFPLVQYSTDCHGGSRSAQITVANVGNSNSTIATTGTWYVGELLIGKGNDGSYGGWSRSSTGHSFPSRPASVTFWYEYIPYETDACQAEIQVIAADGTVIGNATVSANQTVSEWTEAVVPINYTVTNKKAASIYIAFKASTSSSHSCNAGGSYLEIAGNKGEGDKYRIKLSSVLRIDDIVLNY